MSAGFFVLWDVLLLRKVSSSFFDVCSRLLGGCGGSGSGGGDVADGGLGGGVDLEGIGLGRVWFRLGEFEKWSVERGIDAVDAVELLVVVCGRVERLRW